MNIHVSAMRRVLVDFCDGEVNDFAVFQINRTSHGALHQRCRQPAEFDEYLRSLAGNAAPVCSYLSSCSTSVPSLKANWLGVAAAGGLRRFLPAELTSPPLASAPASLLSDVLAFFLAVLDDSMRC